LNCVEKSGIQRYASALGVIVVFPDTSPRGLGYEGEAESWDFGMFSTKKDRNHFTMQFFVRVLLH
jgi:S-formylglutathione hydrolase FrmB